MSKADELVKLDALRQSGVLTQVEFDAKRAHLLGRAPGPLVAADLLTPNVLRSSPDLFFRATSTAEDTAVRRRMTRLLVVLGIVVLLAIAIGAAYLL
jgi:hypothetical protein